RVRRRRRVAARLPARLSGLAARRRGARPCGAFCRRSRPRAGTPGARTVVAESGGGPYALAAAHALPGRVECAAIVCGLGPTRCPGWTDGLAAKERIGYAIAARAPLLAGRVLLPIGAWARRRSRAFLRVTRWQLGEADRDVLQGPLGELVAADFA